MKLTDERIIKFLDKRLEKSGIDREKFLNPTLNDLRNANNLKNIDSAVSKIKQAIKDNKDILVFGDYDTDGICASTILYLYLKSQGAKVQVYIPNRFENGYGISVEAIDEIEFEYEPDLVITVDLGITAVEEVEILKQENIDVVITDHHIPLAELPDTIVVDPKVDPDGTYGFDSLCGAGVALKLVEALSNRETALKYLDICAIATIGDIVPLIDENRVIAKLGIEKINRGECLPSITFMKEKLDIGKITSTDISFKIVPRLNACGRMDNALKAFNFLIETDPKQLEILYAEVEGDNTLRLSAIEKGNKEISKVLEKYDIDEPSALIVGDFHEGVIGILASRVCNELNKPAIIFTKDQEGNLKGSGRSIESIDIHKIISSMAGLLENFGGHKMACGIEILPENFDEFKRIFNENIEKVTHKTDFLVGNLEPDIEIFDDDFNESFINQLNLLEPFGCENEKPKLAIKQNKMTVQPVSEKAFRHYKLYTKKNNFILAFNGYSELEAYKNEAEKLMFVDLGTSEYKGRININAMLKNMKLFPLGLNENISHNIMCSLYNKYYSIFDFNNREKYFEVDNVFEVARQKFAESDYGTIVVASSSDDLEMLEKQGIDTAKYISSKPMTNSQNVIISAGEQIYRLSQVKGYKNIIFLNSYFENEHLYFSQKYNIYENKTKISQKVELKSDRETFIQVYKMLSEFSFVKANDELELAEKLAIKNRTISAEQILFCTLVFMELNFVEFDDILNQITIQKSKKMVLASSKLYQEIEKYGTKGNWSRIYKTS